MIGEGAHFARLAKQLQLEREAAKPTVAEIRRLPSGHLDQPTPAGWQTIGFVYELTEAAREELTRAPERCVDLARLAAATAGSLSMSYPRVLRAQAEALAWKELASGLRFLSRHAAAMQALEIAQRAIANEPALGYDRAVIGLARAVTLREMDRAGEALTVVQNAVAVFSDYADAGRIAQCELLTGMIHHRLADLTAARQAYMRVIPAARAVGDLHTVAAAYNNLARAAGEQQETNAAIDALQQARAVFHELGMPVEVARTTWSIGAALLAAGRFAAAIPILREIRATFLTLAMPEEAGLAGVDLIEALIAVDRRSAARDLASAIVEEFVAAGMGERALHAIAYLKETADAARPEAVHEVGRYLRRLKDDPALLFVPPDLGF